MATKVKNPVLPGFNPDPSILRVGEDFYMATSTFEWYPGIQIYHSKDMVNWELIIRPIEQRHCDMIGDPASGGVWAPCLTHDGELFHLIYTDVKHWDNYSPFKDQLNYLTTAKDIMGPWSDPIYLNGSGFDGSMFHDDDGKKWFVNMEWDHRTTWDDRFSGILIQEYDPKTQKLVGPISKIFEGSSRRRTEGPHIYKKDGYYYLMTAEGGTSYEHAITMARSKNLMGPYELPELHPMCTAWETDAYIQKSGHGALVEDGKGNWYTTHLCGRPLPGTPNCVLGRETAIQNIIWEDGWPKLKMGGNTPFDHYTVPEDVEQKITKEFYYDFQDPKLPIDFQTLRIPFSKSVYSVGGGSLKMRGRESIMSKHSQSLVARRQTDFSFKAETELEFNVDNFQKMAGLSYRYDEYHQYYLYLTYDEKKESQVLEVMSINKKDVQLHTGGIPVNSSKLFLGIDVNETKGQFRYSLDGKTWTNIGKELDASLLSDEGIDPMGFTGAFIGMACQDLQNRSAVADFKSFTYIAK